MADLALTVIMAVWGSSFAILRGLLGEGQASPLAMVSTTPDTPGGTMTRCSNPSRS